MNLVVDSFQFGPKKVAINQPIANYMSHKVKKALALAMIWVARHLGDEPVLAVGSL